MYNWLGCVAECRCFRTLWNLSRCSRRARLVASDGDLPPSWILSLIVRHGWGWWRVCKLHESCEVKFKIASPLLFWIDKPFVDLFQREIPGRLEIRRWWRGLLHDVTVRLVHIHSNQGKTDIEEKVADRGCCRWVSTRLRTSFTIAVKFVPTGGSS